MLFLKVKCCSPSVVSFEFIFSEGPIFERFLGCKVVEDV